MNVASYFKNRFTNPIQNKTYSQNIENSVLAIYKLSKTIHKQGRGNYYPIDDILTMTNGISNISQQIISKLEKLGMNFITENNYIYYKA